MAVRYKLLGRSGLHVSERCPGGMTFGEDWGRGAPQEECEEILRGFVEAGGNFVDSANHDTNGTSERILGELIRWQRERFVLASKDPDPRRDGPNGGGNHRKNLVQSLDASLKRLGTDNVDYWFMPGGAHTHRGGDACAGRRRPRGQYWRPFATPAPPAWGAHIEAALFRPVLTDPSRSGSHLSALETATRPRTGAAATL